MKTLFILAITFFLGFAEAQNVKRLSTEVNLPPTQGVFQVLSLDNLQVASTSYVVSGANGATSAAVASLTTFTHQPDSARNLTVLPVATTGDVESCVVTISGKDINGHSISEAFTFSADASTAQTGSKAFKTVSSVSWPANCESGGFAAKWNIGIGEKIGLSRCLNEDAAFIQSSLNGTLEATRATIATSSSAVSGNTADFNGTMNGTNDFKAYFIPNSNCY